LWNTVVLQTTKISIPEYMNLKVLSIFQNVSHLIISQNIPIDLSQFLPNLPNLSKLVFFSGPVNVLPPVRQNEDLEPEKLLPPTRPRNPSSEKRRQQSHTE